MIVMTSMLLHASRQHLWLAVAVCVLAATPHRHACAAGYSEEAVKAAYLFRFAGYVIWPRRAIPNGDFVIAVVDAPGIARQLTSLAQNHLINDRRVEVREAQSVRNAGTPDMLFVGSGHAESLRLWKPASGSNSALVVTDEDGGLAYGSTLNFLTIDRRVRFEVSLSAAEQARLKISSELLAVALRVVGLPRQSGVTAEALS